MRRLGYVAVALACLMALAFYVPAQLRTQPNRVFEELPRRVEVAFLKMFPNTFLISLSQSRLGIITDFEINAPDGMRLPPARHDTTWVWDSQLLEASPEWLLVRAARRAREEGPGVMPAE